MVTAFAQHAKCIPYGDVADVAGEIIEAKKGRIYQYTRDLVQELKGKGYYLLAHIALAQVHRGRLRYELGFDKSYGTFYATGASNRFTGEIEDEHLS